MEPVPQAVPKGTRHGAYHDSGSDLCDSDTDSPPDSEGNAAAAVSIATKYGLSPDVILRPEAPDVVMRKLGLQEVYEFYGGEAEAKPLEEALHSAFGPLLVYFGISILVDPLRPEGKAYREHLRLREPEGPMAIGSANGKGHQVAVLQLSCVALRCLFLLFFCFFGARQLPKSKVQSPKSKVQSPR